MSLAFRHANAVLRAQVVLRLQSGGADPVALARVDPTAIAQWAEHFAAATARWRFRSGRGW